MRVDGCVGVRWVEGVNYSLSFQCCDFTVECTYFHTMCLYVLSVNSYSISTFQPF